MNENSWKEADRLIKTLGICREWNVAGPEPNYILSRDFFSSQIATQPPHPNILALTDKAGPNFLKDKNYFGLPFKVLRVLSDSI